jgi:hypothetical protein
MLRSSAQKALCTGGRAGEGRLEAIYVADIDTLRPAGPVRFGLAGKRLWHALDKLRAGSPHKGFIPVRPGLLAEVKFFGRYKAGWIRDGVVLSIGSLNSGG